jgi:hypothetical protein
MSTVFIRAVVTESVEKTAFQQDVLLFATREGQSRFL